jgi:putative ABC transport system ATP-binding protein
MSQPRWLVRHLFQLGYPVMDEAKARFLVEATDLAFAYPSGEPVFEDLSFGLNSGRLLAVMGASGVGKSTLLFCLAGVLRPQGDVRLLGELHSGDEAKRASFRLKHCGFIFQRGELLPELTVLENVELPLRMLGNNRSTARASALEALEAVGILGCASRDPSQISGGQAQRASLARALIHTPEIVFADEPTASLDKPNRTLVHGALREVALRGGAVICCTHDPELMELCDEHLTLRHPR